MKDFELLLISEMEIYFGDDKMKATELLKEEHKGIKLMMDILEEICKRFQAGEKVNAEHLGQTVEFFKTFADKCHHAKEEDLLFPEMEKAGIPREGGPIGCMLSEHDQGRALVKELSVAIMRYKIGEKTTDQIVENSNKYIGLLRQHIDKEDNVLYMMADQHLSEEVQEKLLEDFEKVEVERIGVGTHEKFHKLLHHLKDVYLN